MKISLFAATIVILSLLAGCADNPTPVVSAAEAAGIFIPDETLQVGAFHSAKHEGEYVRLRYFAAWANPNGELNDETIDFADQKEVRVQATKVAEKRSLKEPRWDSKLDKLLVPRLSK